MHLITSASAYDYYYYFYHQRLLVNISAQKERQGGGKKRKTESQNRCLNPVEAKSHVIVSRGFFAVQCVLGMYRKSAGGASRKAIRAICSDAVAGAFRRATLPFCGVILLSSVYRRLEFCKLLTCNDLAGILIAEP